MSGIFYDVSSGDIPYLMLFCLMWKKELNVKQSTKTAYVFQSYMLASVELVSHMKYVFLPYM